LVYNGLFGYLAFGFVAHNGAKNGMHGARILMALPGGNYSVFTRLDLMLEPTIAEYKINPDDEKSAFHFWMDPIVMSKS